MAPRDTRSPPPRSQRNRWQFLRRKERELEVLRPDIREILASAKTRGLRRESGELLTLMERTLALLGSLRQLAGRPLRRRQERILWYRKRQRFRDTAQRLHERVRSLRIRLRAQA